MEFKAKQKKGIHLDITPVVDTVFNLLIFFALSFNFTAPTAFNIHLPNVASPEKPEAVSPVVIHIPHDGSLYVNNNPLDSPDELSRFLTHKTAPSAHTSVIIHADKRVPHGTVIQVMDICKTAGFHKLSIAAAAGKRSP